ncbi:MAG TPA: lipopolysaccharide heptosyltransferase II [Trichocoleus sp.]|jgi:lipopolysaccharide heptosyltransferase II
MSSWNTAKNILCVRLDSIGDVLMTTPAIRALKTHPDCRITLLTSASGATVAPLIPEIDQVIVYDAPWLKATDPRSSSSPEYAMIERLRQEKFDAAVVFTVYSQNPLPSAFLCYMADIPLRLAHCHENVYQLLTDWVKDPEPEQFTRHEVQRQLDLVASVGFDIQETRMAIQIPAGTIDRVQSLLVSDGLILDQPWLVLHPGATAPSRRYPPEQYAIVARKLVQDAGMQIVFTGTQAEQALVQQIQSEMGVSSFSLVDRLTLAELAALLSITPLLLSNNTGPVHLAAAVGTAIVDLYALTNLQHTPWGVPNRVLFHDVPCRICYKSVCPEGHHHCLRLVEPETVVEAVLDLFHETSSNLPINLPVPLLTV